MIKIDAVSLLDDFADEARAHIDEIEAAFLDVDTFVGPGPLMDGIFRAAHSLKGTAGLLSLEAIVAVAHELEGMFARIKAGSLTVNEEIADVVLRGVDRLRDLVAHLRDREAVDTDSLLEELKGYATPPDPAKGSGKLAVPFDLKQAETADRLQNAVRRGHFIYYLKIAFNRGLGKYYEHPRGLIDEIMSVGAIVAAVVNRAAISGGTDLAAGIIDELSKHDTTTMELLVTSILEPDLLLVALELEERFVRLISKEMLTAGADGSEAGAEAKSKSMPGPVPAPPGTESGAEAVTNKQTEVPVPPPDKQPETAAALPASKADFSIRLDVLLVNELMDLANELILTRNELKSVLTREQLRKVNGLAMIVQNINRLTSEIQEKTVQTRMQPVSAIFGKFPRMIRDTARLLNKDIELLIEGDDIALDKYLLEALVDPLTQLIKNAADHGIEAADRRQSIGKPSKGTIRLRAWRQDGQAIIEVTDDGAGIDSQALGQKGLDLKLINNEQLQVMTAKEILALVFEPGLSTVKQVTNLSGRGVGMDIVKTNIEKLGGMIEIDSKPDAGTAFRLKMPLTLSAVRSLIIKINGVLYAVPETNVERIVRISAAAPTKRLELNGDKLWLDQNGWRIPVVTIADIVSRAGERDGRPDEKRFKVGKMDRLMSREVVKCLVLRGVNRYFALLIDDAIQTEETLVKPLPIYLRNCRCYANVTVLGSGDAVTVLDAEGIMNYLEIDGAGREIIVDTGEMKQNDLRTVIVFEGRKTEYFAVDAERVARIVKVGPDYIKEAADGPYMELGGERVAVLKLEKYLPNQLPGPTADGAGDSRASLLLLKNGGPPVGLLVGKALERIAGQFTRTVKPTEYIIGTGQYNKKVIFLLDINKIIKT